jgi:hypothetical protein
MMYVHLAIGDICEDPTGLLVRVQDIDIYDYVHFSVIESSTRGFDETEPGEMSHVAFSYRFTKLGNMLLKQDSRSSNDGPAHSFGEPDYRLTNRQ